MYPKTSAGNTRPIAASNSFVAQTRRCVNCCFYDFVCTNLYTNSYMLICICKFVFLYNFTWYNTICTYNFVLIYNWQTQQKKLGSPKKGFPLECTFSTKTFVTRAIRFEGSYNFVFVPELSGQPSRNQDINQSIPMSYSQPL
jgi:hypothetical protein